MKSNQSGFGIVGLLIAVALFGVIGWMLLSRIAGEDGDKLESANQIIDDAQNTVDKANDVKDKAEALAPDL